MKNNTKFAAFPYAIWSVIFIAVPLLLVVYFAFTTNPDFSMDNQWTFANISAVGKYMPVIVRSIVLAIVSTIICLLICYPAAMLIAIARPANQRTLQLLMIIPMWMNFLLRTYAWMTLLDRGGFVDKFFIWLGVGSVTLLNTQGAVVLGMVYNYLPFMILPLYANLSKIDATTVEAAQDLGANSWQVFRKIILPLTVPGISTGVTMVFVPAVSTFIISRMLGGGTSSLIGDLIEFQFSGLSYNPNLGSAMAIVLMVIILLFMSLFNQFGDEEEMEGTLL